MGLLCVVVWRNVCSGHLSRFPDPARSCIQFVLFQLFIRQQGGHKNKKMNEYRRFSIGFQ